MDDRNSVTITLRGGKVEGALVWQLHQGKGPATSKMAWPVWKCLGFFFVFVFFLVCVFFSFLSARAFLFVISRPQLLTRITFS